MMRSVVVVAAIAAAACSGGGGGSGTGGGTGGSGGGTGGSGGGTGGPVTIAGKVVDIYGNVAAGATVVVIGKSPTTTDAMGAFSIANVTPPYDVATVTTAGGISFVTVFSRLTRTNPTLLSISQPMVPNTSSVSGNLSGPGVTLPAPALRRAAVWFESPDVGSSTTTTTNPYTVQLGWSGPATTTGTVHAMYYQETAAGAPSDYVAYGKLENVLIANGTTATMKDVAMTAMAEQQLTGTVTAPAGFTIGSKAMALLLGKATVGLGADLSAAAAFGFSTPSVAGATFEVSATVTGMGTTMGRRSTLRKRGLMGNATNVSLSPPTPPGLSLPVQSATGINLGTQSFSWSPMEPAGVYVLGIALGSTISFNILTTATSATLPPTTEVGVGTVAANTTCQWNVSGYRTAAMTLDAVVADPNPYNAILGVSGDTAAGDSERRSFTTQ